MPDFSTRRKRRTKRPSVQEVFEDTESIPEAGPSSSSLPVPTRHSTLREPKRKALLVGVSDALWDEEIQSEERNQLVLRAHEDVRIMTSLLIDDLGFRREDVCIMMDNGDIAPNYRPTKRNVLKRLRRMIRNAITGDSFFFYFSGHGFQLKCESGTESDGFDEYIQCEDGNSIKDNELHDTIVKPLPDGCQLVALFDSCHAGTMLDLPHYSCNTVVTVGLVFVAIGRMQHRVVITSNAATVSPPPSRSFSPVRQQPGSFRCRHRSVRRSSTLLSLSPSTPIPSSISGPARSKPTATSSATVFGTPAHSVTSTRVRSASVSVQVRITVPTSSTTAPPAEATPVTSAPTLLRSRGNSVSSRGRSSSSTRKPVPEKCDGMCDPPEVPTGPRVISLGASADNELSYEKEAKGGLMTAYFVEIMKANKQPVFRDLMIELRQRFAQEYRERRRLVQQHEDALLKSKQPGPLPDFDDLKSMQRPQLSSLHPLDLTQRLVL